jgi:DNA primase
MEIVDQIRQAANIVDIASQYTTLRRRGRRHVGLCPFHSEKDPSFTVDDEKQLFHCFGCGMGGDIFTLIMEKENLSFPEALRYLAEKYNIPLPQKRQLSAQQQKLEEKIHQINQSTLAFFKKNLFNTQEGKRALDYLKKRYISEEIIQELKIGYALESWDSLLSFFRRKNISPQDLEKAGLALPRQKREGYYDRFRGRIIFPIFNLTGKVVAFGGRTVLDAEPKYLNSPDTPVFSKGKLLYGLNFCREAIREKREVILVEGYTDFISLYKSGIRNIAASLGTSLTSGQVIQAARFADRIVIGFDADSAGKKATSRAISLCFENGVEIKVLNLPPKTDPDSFIHRKGVQAFQALVENSTPGLRFLIDFHLQQGNRGSPEEKSKLVKSVLEEIEKIPDRIVRSEYLKKTSEYIDVEEDVLRSVSRRKIAKEESKERKLLYPAEKRLLQILMADKLIAPYVYSEMEEEDFRDLHSEPIFRTLVRSIKNGKDLNFHEIKEKIDPPLLSYLSEILMEREQTSTLEEALDCLYTLRKLSLEKRSKELKAEIARLEKQGEKEKLRSLLSQRLDLAKQILLLSKRNDQQMGYNKKEIPP